jgi:hypothetical protein
MEVNILPWHLAYTLLGGVILEPSDKLLRRCPHGHLLKCRGGGVAEAVPITIDKVNVHLEIHIFDILDFDLFLGYPIKQIVDASQGSLEAKLREITFAATTTCLENQMAMSFPKQNPSEKEIHPSPSSVEFETLSVGPESFILDFGQNPSMISHDESPEMENPQTTELREMLTLESKEIDPLGKHGILILETPQSSCSFKEPPESVPPHAHIYEGHNHLSILISYMSRRMVVDAFVYHKHCRFSSMLWH